MNQADLPRSLSNKSQKVVVEVEGSDDGFRSFKFLTTDYVAFAYKDMGALAEIRDTWTIETKLKRLKTYPRAWNAIAYEELLKQLRRDIAAGDVDKADWYVPIYMTFMVWKDTVSMDFDLLYKVGVWGRLRYAFRRAVRLVNLRIRRIRGGEDVPV